MEDYWVFACNPKHWPIDKHLDDGKLEEPWQVHDCYSHEFAAGQLGLIRVGSDGRTESERNGRPRLEAGIYVLCEIVGEAFRAPATRQRRPRRGQPRVDAPHVNLRFLRNYKPNPLTIGFLKQQVPDMERQLISTTQGTLCFKIESHHFREIIDLLNDNLDELSWTPRSASQIGINIAQMEDDYCNACPEIKERVSRLIERGVVGAAMKKAAGFRCQICAALGIETPQFRKPNGEPYVEAHHVMPLHKRQVGSLAPSNIIVLCANHHRQMHHGCVDVMRTPTTFDLKIDGVPVNIPRLTEPTRLEAGASVVGTIHVA